MNQYNVDIFLEHFGVKGMRWGQRQGLDGVPPKTYREARKDAHEFARAKMFYGEGAGNRRKLINKSVEAKSSRDQAYKKAFDYHLKSQNLADHAQAARSERHRKDIKNTTAKTARGIKNTILGNPQYATVTAIGLAYAGKAAYNAGVHKKISKYGKTAYNAAKVNIRAMKIKQEFKKYGWA